MSAAPDCAPLALPVRVIDRHTEALEVERAPPRAVFPVALELAELLAAEFPPRRMLLAPWLESQSLTMLYAWRGVGKTHVALGIAYALASGGEILGWSAPEPVPVLYLDGEMPGAALRERVARIVAASDRDPPAGYMRYVTPDCQPDGVMPDLATYDGQYAVETILRDAQVIVVDNLSCLVRHPGARENDAESWMPVAEWGLRMRSAGRAVVFVHHAAKGGQQRGTSKREDLLDTSILLRRPSDYTPDQGARFVIEFAKARALHGQDVEPIEAALTTDTAGRQQWVTRPAADSTDRQMIELAELGMSQADIARELCVHRSTVHRALRRAEQEGRYHPATGGQHGR